MDNLYRAEIFTNYSADCAAETCKVTGNTIERVGVLWGGTWEILLAGSPVPFFGARFNRWIRCNR